MSDMPSSDAAPAPDLRAADGAVRPAADARDELARLYRSHLPRFKAYFRRCGLSETTARDLAQETFVSALRAVGDFKGQSQLATWVWAIARNVWLMHLRSAASRPQADVEPAADPDELTSPAPSHLNPLDDCVRRGFARFAAEHPERAQVIYLAVVEGWTRDELASHLGRSVHAATEYLSQCKAKLKPYLEDCHDC